MPNLEIKALCPDLDDARRLATEIGARFIGRDRQVDTYFRTSQGRFKLRESSLSGVELIPYLRPDLAGPKKSDYAVIPVPDGPRVKALLTQLLGVVQIVEKVRDIYLLDNVRIHLDDVSGLGRFLEFEAVYEGDSEETRNGEERKLKGLLKAFHIHDSQLLQGSYRELLPGTSRSVEGGEGDASG